MEINCYFFPTVPKFAFVQATCLLLTCSLPEPPNPTHTGETYILFHDWDNRTKQNLFLQVWQQNFWYFIPMAFLLKLGHETPGVRFEAVEDISFK